MDSKWYSESRGTAASHEEQTEAEPSIVYRRFMPAAMSSLILMPCSVNINVGEAYNPTGCPGHFPQSAQGGLCNTQRAIQGPKPSYLFSTDNQNSRYAKTILFFECRRSRRADAVNVSFSVDQSLSRFSRRW